ncbi:MAG TPA: hypothetical protein VMR18_03965 [Candidatus Saccharimonadales bacterium]|nr:hypothetical protein [Candidatus Saccharimonadales bacterium]
MGPTIVDSSLGQSGRSPLRRKGRLLILLIVAVIVIGGIALFSGLKSGPSGVATSFVNDIVKNEASQSYQLTDQSFRSATTYQQWQSTVSYISKQYSGNPELVSLTGGTTDTSTPIAKFTEGGTIISHQIQVNLLFSGGHWRIDYFFST